MSEKRNDTLFEELDLLFTEDAFGMTKSIEKKLTNKEIAGLKGIVELARKAEDEIIRLFQKNYLSREIGNSISYPIPLTREKHQELGELFRISAILIACRNDTDQEDVQQAISMLDSDGDFPEYDLIIQFKKHSSKEAGFFLKRVFVQKRGDGLTDMPEKSGDPQP